MTGSKALVQTKIYDLSARAEVIKNRSMKKLEYHMCRKYVHKVLSLRDTKNSAELNRHLQFRRAHKRKIIYHVQVPIHFAMLLIDYLS